VDRDELPDQGAGHFAQTVSLLRQKQPKILIECLTPDFQGERQHVATVANSGLNVFAHNLETVERLQRRVRDYRASYAQSLSVLQMAKEIQPHLITKTSLMLGLGESDSDLEACLRDLRGAGVDVVTFGQYLRPTRRHMSVQRFVPPEEFASWQQRAEDMGFKYVASGPLVRSSYRAGEFFIANMLKEQQSTTQQQ
jgi:lipoic acid synthetase